MTPFMHSVQDLLDGKPAPGVATVRSEPGPVPAATDAQVIVRSLAEQLVSEANAVLRSSGDLIRLDDEVGPGGLTFTLGYRERNARVQTAVSGRSALARLTIDGQAEDQPRRLSGAGELQALVLSLIADRPRLPTEPGPHQAEH
jgi:hypothetical protein